MARRSKMSGVAWPRGRAQRVAPALVGLILAVVVGFAPEAQAHAGHDHGPTIEVSASVAPRFEAASDDFEVVAVLRGADLILTLDRFRTNEPITVARIGATVNGATAFVTANTDGTFTLQSAQLTKPGRAEILLTIEAGGVSDLLAGAVDVPAVAVAPVRPLAWWQRLPLPQNNLAAVGCGLLAGVLLTQLLRRSPWQRHTGRAQVEPTDETSVEEQSNRPMQDAKPQRSAVIVAISLGAIVPVVGLGPARDAMANEPGKVITINADLPQRLPDGSLFVPKVTQRLLSIRTVMAGESTAGSTVQLTGQIIADPNGFGRVQAIVDGRIDVPRGGLLVVSGQKVERGQALALLTPIVSTADRSTYESAAGEIDTRIALAEAKLARLTRIAGFVAQKDIDDTRTELETLKTRRGAVRSVVRETVTLTAPISGIVSMSAAVPGQLATARETLFEIVDPSRLWVEAITFDARFVADITAARAVDATGLVLDLDFVGRAATARQQGLPLQFSIRAPPTTLVIGKPVTVLLTTRETRQGMILPQAAVVKGQNGLSIVWTHTQAERFKPNIVKVTPIDGQRVLVEGGLAANERVVIEGATLLNQVR